MLGNSVDRVEHAKRDFFIAQIPMRASVHPESHIFCGIGWQECHRELVEG